MSNFPERIWIELDEDDSETIHAWPCNADHVPGEELYVSGNALRQIAETFRRTGMRPLPDDAPAAIVQLHIDFLYFAEELEKLIAPRKDKV